MRAAALALLVALVIHSMPQAQFRSEVVEVAVSVSVTTRNQTVGGLTHRDFRLFDNGTLQTLRPLEIEAIPVDVTVVLDSSGSTAADLATWRSQALEISRSLRADDRFSLILADTFLRQLRPMSAAEKSATYVHAPLQGTTAIYDAVAAALLRPVIVGRRHLIVVMTDGYDNTSVARLEDLMAIAKRSEAALHVILSAPSTVRERRPRLWWPNPSSFEPTVLRDIARATGGEIIQESFLGTINIGAAFRRVFDRFRGAYVLRYSPEHVALPGWHAIKVELPGYPRYQVRARPGYFLETRSKRPEQ